MSTSYDIRRMGKRMTRLQQAKHDCRHVTRKVWAAMFLAVALIVGWGLLIHAIHQNGRAAQHVDDAR